MGEDLAVGDLIVHNDCAVRIFRTDREQVWAQFPTGDPGSEAGLLTAAPRWTVRRAVIGETVCPTPRGGCWCGLAHLPAEQHSWLREKGDA